MPDQDAEESRIAAVKRALAEAGAAVVDRHTEWQRAIQHRDQTILKAYFLEGLRPFLIAEATGVNNSTVHLVLRGEKTRRKAEGRPFHRGADAPEK